MVLLKFQRLSFQEVADKLIELLVMQSILNRFVQLHAYATSNKGREESEKHNVSAIWLNKTYISLPYVAIKDQSTVIIMFKSK